MASLHSKHSLHELNEIRQCKRTFLHSSCMKSEAKAKRWKKQPKCEKALSCSLILFSSYGNACYIGYRTNISLASVSLKCEVTG